MQADLHSPERHVHVAPTTWDPGRARAWLTRWAAAALADRDADDCWPLHPRDAADLADFVGPLHELYCGSLGVWLALARLADAGHCRLPEPAAELFPRLAAAYTARDAAQRVPSWFLGESSLLTASWLARPDEHTATRLEAVVRGNRDNPTREALWGAPGTMIGALFLHEATGEDRWADVFRDSADALWSSWQLDETTDVWLWEQDLYGQRVRYVGAGHGWIGNLYPLWRGHALLRGEQQAQLRERTLQGLEKLARVDGERANWPTFLGPPRPMLVQWCHGAPGIITSLRHADLPEALPLLIKAARTIVHAGPLAKGPALCHGTDGNGAALLEMHRRTGDEAWLAHARAFAMASIEQSEATLATHGVWRHSLWTGDAGLACFLLDCLAGRSRGMPGLDSFQ